MMNKQQIAQLIDKQINESGVYDTGITGLQLFKITHPIQCAPAVYQPSVTAIVSGGKEAVLEGKKHYYDQHKYICCTMPMPLETGTPNSSPNTPLLGVYLSIDHNIMSELCLKMESTPHALHAQPKIQAKGLTTATWDNNFTDALYRLLLLINNPLDRAILSETRLRELYYAILKGEAGYSFKQAFGVGNKIAQAIEYLSSHLPESVTIDDLAKRVGMSRSVFHRKFKQVTNMSPIQFVKSMRLNHAAMKIAQGATVNVAAMDVGYTSNSQFSREFKRLFGQSPKQWRQHNSTIGI